MMNAKRITEMVIFFIILNGTFIASLAFWKGRSTNGFKGRHLRPRYCKFDGDVTSFGKYFNPYKRCWWHCNLGGIDRPCFDKVGNTGICKFSGECNSTQGSCNFGNVCCTNRCPAAGTGDRCTDGQMKFGICSCSCGENSTEIANGDCSSGLKCCRPEEARFILLPEIPDLTASQQQQRCIEIGRGLPLPQNTNDLDEMLSLALSGGADPILVQMVTGLRSFNDSIVYPNVSPFTVVQAVINGDNIEAFLAFTNVKTFAITFPKYNKVYPAGFSAICERFY